MTLASHRLSRISVILVSVACAGFAFRLSRFEFGIGHAATNAPAIDVTFAPDQPVPFVYVDDPLIVEFVSDSDTGLTGEIEFIGNDGTKTRVEVPECRLRAQGEFWLPLNGAPRDKGLYRAHVTLDAGGAPVELDRAFCRIERPRRGPRPSVCVRLKTPDRASLLAYRGIPIRAVELDAAAPDATESAELAESQDYRVSLSARLADLGDAETTLESMAKTLGERAAAWSLDADGDPGAFDAAVNAIRRGGSRAPIAVTVDDAAALEPYLANGSARNIAAATLAGHEAVGESLTQVHRVAEEAGYEGFSVYVSGVGGRADEPVVRQWVECVAAGAQRCNLEPAQIFADGQFGPAYVELSALLRNIDGSAYVGDMVRDGTVRAAVFRDGSRWTIVAWARDEAQTKGFPLGAASNLVESDDCGNPMETPALEDGNVNLALGVEPHYLSGDGGNVIALAARAAAKREADGFLGDDAFQDALPAELTDLVKTIADSKTGRTDRLNFFGLLRMFPFLEQQWHDGTIPKAVAIPAMASLARLVRSLCILEQEAGEPFIELLQETLARSGEYQSQYLTGTGGAKDGHERADWLSAEVGRLMAEAKKLAEQDREIEAVGVASLAEWRARSLEFAARAEPTTEPETTGE